MDVVSGQPPYRVPVALRLHRAHNLGKTQRYAAVAIARPSVVAAGAAPFGYQWQSTKFGCGGALQPILPAAACYGGATSATRHHHRRCSRHEWDMVVTAAWSPGNRAPLTVNSSCASLTRERGFGDNRSASANGHNLCAQRGNITTGLTRHWHLAPTDQWRDRYEMVVVHGPKLANASTVFKCYDCLPSSTNRRVDERKSIPIVVSLAAVRQPPRT